MIQSRSAIVDFILILKIQFKTSLEHIRLFIIIYITIETIIIDY